MEQEIWVIIKRNIGGPKNILMSRWLSKTERAMVVESIRRDILVEHMRQWEVIKLYHLNSTILIQEALRTGNFSSRLDRKAYMEEYREKAQAELKEAREKNSYLVHQCGNLEHKVETLKEEIEELEMDVESLKTTIQEKDFVINFLLKQLSSK